MRKNNNTKAVEAPVQVAVNEAPAVDAAPKKRTSRSRKKVDAPAEKKESVNVETPKTTETPIVENPKAETAEPVVAKFEELKPATKTNVEETKPAAKAYAEESKPAPQVKPIPRMPSNLVIRDFCDLSNAGNRIPLLNDQQVQQLTIDDACQRYMVLEAILANVLDYDIVLSDTNIWLELLVGHTSSHSDPRVNARLQFERQLEFISRMMKRIGGKFMIMSETYEEIDRFASIQEPTNYKDADWSDEILCRNVAARLAKRLMLSQQKENRLRIEGIGSESHHGAFADPAIIRHTVELFAHGKRVLLLTNDASVGIRSLGMCDDLQRTNNIDDKTWREVYEPQRPMVLTMDDLKLLDAYTRQYHFLMMAAGRQWMQDVKMREPVTLEAPLELWLEGFRPGDRHERRSDRIEQQRRDERERQERERKAEEQRKAAAAKNKQKQAEKPVEKSTEKPVEKTSEKPVEKAVEKPTEKPVETPIEELVEEPAEKAEVQNEVKNETSFGETSEMMELIAPPTGEKKSRTRRGNRRRNSNRNK